MQNYTPLDFAKLKDRHILHTTKPLFNTLFLLIGALTLVLLASLLQKLIFSR